MLWMTLFLLWSYFMRSGGQASLVAGRIQMEREGTCPTSVGFQGQVHECLHFSFGQQMKQSQTTKSRLLPRQLLEKQLEKPFKADGSITKLSLPLERVRQTSGMWQEISRVFVLPTSMWEEILPHPVPVDLTPVNQGLGCFLDTSGR